MKILKYRPPTKDMRCPMCHSYKTAVIVDTDGYYAQCDVCNTRSAMFQDLEEAQDIWRV